MLESIIACCRAAGAEVLRCYGADAPVTYKEDRSPLTVADQASHELLVKALSELTPAVPVVSEESPAATMTCSKDGTFWLVDPLDGTKEFLKRSGDFTVNVALIQDGRPVMGVVFAPARETIYFAERGRAWRQANGGEPVRIQTRPAPGRALRVVASKDHAGAEVEALLRRIPDAKVTSIGSSLKLCMVAEGEADFYPRFVGTMEWDTAAAQCIVESAGGAVMTLDGKALTYGKDTGWRNPAIITVGDLTLRWQDWV